MGKELELSLRRLVTRYITGEAQLADLHAWIAAEAWNIDERADAGVAQLFHDAELLLSEHAHGDWTEDEVKNRLSPLAAYITVEASVSLFQLSAGTPYVFRHSVTLAPASEPITLTLEPAPQTAPPRSESPLVLATAKAS